MAKVKTIYGPWSERMLSRLCEIDGFKVASFTRWLRDKGVNVKDGNFTQWKKGYSHLPADALPLLAEYLNKPELVFSEYIRVVDSELLRLHPTKTSKGDLIDDFFIASDYMGRLSRAFFSVREPDSDDGQTITPSECEFLLDCLNDSIQKLVNLRSRLLHHISEKISI